MLKVNIVFIYTNKYGCESREFIVADVKTNSNGDIELKTIMEKLKSYGYAKTRISDLKVFPYSFYFKIGYINLV